MDLTKQERQAVVFVMAVSLAGIGMEYLSRYVKPLERGRLMDGLGKIDLNNADRAALESLPGVGARLAQRIIDYREKNDGFSEVEELGKVKGMHAALVRKLKDCVRVR